ncbi:MAG: hypothetical protein IKM32_02770 [Clostridia bacterium]|nr:hypothetical protein [Clostridia bacterium]
MARNKKIRIALSVMLALVLIGVAVFAVLGFLEVKRESEQLAEQPGTSGVDFLGVGMVSAMIVITCMTVGISSVDLYWCLCYFLTSKKRTKRKKLLNAISLILSLLAFLSVPLYFITYFDIPLSLGWMWSFVCPIYRIVYLAVTVGRAESNKEIV